MKRRTCVQNWNIAATEWRGIPVAKCEQFAAVPHVFAAEVHSLHQKGVQLIWSIKLVFA